MPKRKQHKIRAGQMVEAHTSMANRQNLSFEAPVAAFARGKAHIDAEKERNRIERSQGKAPAGPFPVMVSQESLQRERDWDAIHNYRHHYADYRGAQTQKKGNLVRKREE